MRTSAVVTWNIYMRYFTYMFPLKSLSLSYDEFFFTWFFYLTWSGTGSRIIELIKTWDKRLRIHSLVIITHFIVPHCWQLQTKCTVFLIVRPFLKILLQFGLRFLQITLLKDRFVASEISVSMETFSLILFVCVGGEEPPVARGRRPAWRLHSTWAEAWECMDVR